MTDHLPTVASGGAADGGIGAALEHLVARLNNSVHFDDVNLSLHVEEHADGGRRTVFNYRCYKHQRR